MKEEDDNTALSKQVDKFGMTQNIEVFSDVQVKLPNEQLNRKKFYLTLC